jgi:hypothetical protein
VTVPSSFFRTDGSNTTLECWRSAGACTIGASEAVDFDGTIVARSVSFAANTGVPVLSARPNSGLPVGGELLAVGANFTPERDGRVCQGVASAGPFTLDSCGDTSGIDQGPKWTSADIGGDGSFVGYFYVDRYIFVAAENRWFDCALPGASCVVYGFEVYEVNEDLLVGKSAVTPITLADPPPPPATRGQVTAAPTFGLRAGDNVRVTASGFREGLPGVALDVSVCKTGATTKADCDMDWGYAINGSTVNYQFPLDAGHVMTMFDGTQYDCRAQQDACVLAVAEKVDFPGTVVTVPLDTGWEPVRTLTVSPATDLISGQAVHVTGTNFPPNATIQLRTCVDVFLHHSCTTTADSVPTDSAGNLDGTMHPQRVWTTSGLSHDCQQLDGCFVQAEHPRIVTRPTRPVAFVDVQPDGQVYTASSHTLAFDNVYSLFGGTAQLRQHAVAANGKWVFAVRVQNDGPVVDDIAVKAPVVSANGRFTVRYLVGYYDVTAYVATGTFTYENMAPGETRKLAVQFTAAPGTPAGDSFAADLQFKSTTDPVAVDVVRLRAWV